MESKLSGARMHWPEITGSAQPVNSPEARDSDRPGQLSLQRDVRRSDLAADGRVLAIEPVDEDNPHKTAERVLDSAVIKAARDPDLAKVVAMVGSGNPSKSANQVLKYSQAWLIEKYLQATRPELSDNAYEGQCTFRPRAYAVLEASVLARMQSVEAGASPQSDKIPVASKLQAAARELDVNFARDLALKLRAYVVDDATSAAIQKGDSRATVIENVVMSIVRGTASHQTNEGLNMTSQERAFAMTFCKEMGERLMGGVEFSARVDQCLKNYPRFTRDDAQASCAVGLAREVLAEMGNG